MGVLYICKAQGPLEILKVGISETASHWEERAKAHQRDGYRGMLFEPYFAVETPKYREIEQLMKQLFSKSRLTDTELYVIEKEVLRKLFELFAHKVIFSKDSIKPIVLEEDVKLNKKAPRIKRSMLGIKYGDHLFFSQNERFGKNFVVENIDDDIVRYEGNDYSISAIALRFVKECGYKTPAVSGNDWFTFNGKILSTLATEQGLIGKTARENKL